MNKKVKIFYIIDLFIIGISIICMIILDNQHTYGLAALTSVGYFVFFAIICIISMISLVAISIVYFIIKRKNNKNM